MSELLKRADYLLSETEPARLEPARAEVAFIGRSNVGKSSFLNALCQKRGLANVSKTPGRTRAINVFAVDYLRWLIDLPGYGYAVGPAASRAKWPQMIETYLTSRPSLRAIFVLIDAKVGPTKLDHSMREWLRAAQLPYFIIANKIDQVKPSQRFKQQRSIADALRVAQEDIQWVSATENTGMAPVRHEVTRLLQEETPQ
jgi:GTP-binding protein